MSDESSEAVNENQNRLAESGCGQTQEKIMKPTTKAKTQREKDPKKVAAGKKLAEKNRQAKAALVREKNENVKWLRKKMKILQGGFQRCLSRPYCR